MWTNQRHLCQNGLPYQPPALSWSNFLLSFGFLASSLLVSERREERLFCYKHSAETSNPFPDLLTPSLRELLTCHWNCLYLPQHHLVVIGTRH